jgi:hypothetical protein
MRALPSDAIIEFYDDLHRKAMLRGSAGLLRAIYRARGVVAPQPAPEPEPEPPAPPAYVAPDPLPVQPDDIIAQIGDALGASYDEIVSARRWHELIPARNTCYRVLRDRGMSTSQIGRHIGGRDHTTVIHGLRSFDAKATPKMREVAAAFARAQ